MARDLERQCVGDPHAAVQGRRARQAIVVEIREMPESGTNVNNVGRSVVVRIVVADVVVSTRVGVVVNARVVVGRVVIGGVVVGRVIVGDVIVCDVIVERIVVKIVVRRLGVVDRQSRIVVRRGRIFRSGRIA
ncbi:MAG: hypothetical protein KJ042_00350 [Deltaproteobacteria bacterium]|nr:hypothetical protein [Deltaproteobacteria bacterium]